MSPKLSQPAESPDTEALAELAQIRRTFRLFKRTVYILAGLILAAALVWAATGAYHHLHHKATPPSPVPLSIRRGVNFSVYYPDPAKLPAGCSLNTASFSSGNQAVIYDVLCSSNKKIVFSVQQKPTATALQGFYKNHLPLHNDVKTNVGTAAIGAIGPQTVVSLPTNGNAWLIITTALPTNQTNLKQVLQTITK
jgi:hypothetical protein